MLRTVFMPQCLAVHLVYQLFEDYVGYSVYVYFIISYLFVFFFFYCDFIFYCFNVASVRINVFIKYLLPKFTSRMKYMCVTLLNFSYW